MEKFIDTFCPECDEPVRAEIITRTETLPVKGEPIEYSSRVSICPSCGEEIGDSRVEQENFETAFRIYCRKHGLVTKDEVIQLRRSTELSLREFSRFLGFGEQTAARYEMGSVPDVPHSNTMRIASNVDGARMLLDLNGRNMSEKSVERVKSYIHRLEVGEEPSPLWYALLDDRKGDMTEFNGYRVIDSRRVAALVRVIAGKCEQLYKTKLQKAMFFCDFYAFEKNGRSLTGMTYAHANYGPVMENYDLWLKKLERDGAIQIVPFGNWGEIVTADDSETHLFTNAELNMIRSVCDFVNTFGSAGEISDYSHKLAAWRETDSGKPISYQACNQEVINAVESRLRA